MGKYVKECFVTKVFHFDALNNWSKLNVGNKVFLLGSQELDDEVRVMLPTDEGEGCTKATFLLKNVDGFSQLNFNDGENLGDKKITIPSENLDLSTPKCDIHIGNLSKEDSLSIIDVINSGYSYVYYGRIAYLDEKSEENKRIKVVIYIKDNNKKHEEE